MKTITTYARRAWLSLAFLTLMPATECEATSHTIQFVCCQYNPNTLTVAVGDTIVWNGGINTFFSHPLHSTSVPPGADTFFVNSTTSTFVYVVIVPGAYAYRCDNHFSFGMTGSFDALVTGVGDQQNLAGSYQLHQNFPNPFNPATTIRFSVPSAQVVTLKVFDILGNEVATLVSGRKSPGSHTVAFDGANLASGIYLYRLQAGDFVDTKKLLLMK